MHYILVLVIISIAQLSLLTPTYAETKLEMCQIAEQAIEKISIKIGDSKKVTENKKSLVHFQCFNAPISELEETYLFLIENWDSIFDTPIPD